MVRFAWRAAVGSAAVALLGVATWAAFVGLTYGYAVLHRDADPLPQAQAIVVISGIGSEEYLATKDTAARVVRGIALWEAGLAPIIVMSGDAAHAALGHVPNSVGMVRLAMMLGVPRAALVEEDRSHSTLQNALYTAALPEIDPEAPILLVTNRYHLLRSWQSFRWAGFAHVVPVAADTTATGSKRLYHMEGVKWGGNLLRALGASAALAVGVPEARVHGWLD